uniref:Uncharacterized protein n=1 Tax=Zea mays TaxID=4577 RepID=B6SGW5_MAIZE|nr:hypothetical protein [Zea mays]
MCGRRSDAWLCQPLADDADTGPGPVHGAWLPPLFAAQYAHYTEVVAGHWNKQGKPAVQNVLHKA